MLHPRYLEDFSSCDLALITLEKPLKNAPVIILNRATDELRDTVTGVGFGVSGPAHMPELVIPYSVKIAGQNIIDSIGGPLYNGIATEMYADFDAPGKLKNCNSMGSAKPLDLEYSPGGGDSGGPLFRTKTGNCNW